MTDSVTKFEAQIERLAKHIVDKATDKDADFPESVQALKALTAYYALLLKHEPDPEGDSGGFSFASEEPPHAGKARLRGDRGN